MDSTAKNTTDSQKNRGVTFVTSQRGKQLPLVDGYIFVCKDSERRRFRCKTKGCCATLILKRDDCGVFYEGTPRHEHPPHDVALASLEHRNAMRRAAGTKREDATTRSVVMEANRCCSTRRLSSDLRFVRRLRKGQSAPKKASDIVFSEELSRFVLFNTPENDIIVFGDPGMLRCASSVTFISVDRTFSRCPTTHYQLVTCHAVCQNGFSFPFAFGLLPDKRRPPTQSSFHRSTRFRRRGLGRTFFLETASSYHVTLNGGSLGLFLECAVPSSVATSIICRRYGGFCQRQAVRGDIVPKTRSVGTYVR